MAGAATPVTIVAGQSAHEQSKETEVMEMRMRRVLAPLLGILAVASFAPQLASADTTTGALGGTVTNSAQQDIAGVQVTVTNLGTGDSYSATTGSDGTYPVSGLPAGSYQVLFSPNNGQGQNYVYQYYSNKSNAAAAQAVSVTAGQTTSHVDAALATGATVSGKVTDAATGAAVAGVYVYVYDYGNYGPTTSRPTTRRRIRAARGASPVTRAGPIKSSSAQGSGRTTHLSTTTR